jgi:hypothetical protein
MTDLNVKNMAASVHQRLLNAAKQAGRPFNELLQYYSYQAISISALQVVLPLQRHIIHADSEVSKRF